MTKLKRYYPYFAGAWALIILVVSVIPGEDLPSLSIWEPDKVMHALVYGILCYLLAFSIAKNRFIPKQTILYAIVLCILYGFVIELIQLLLPTRSFDLLDAVANSTGCLLAGGLILLFSGLRRGKITD